MLYVCERTFKPITILYGQVDNTGLDTTTTPKTDTVRCARGLKSPHLINTFFRK